MIKLPHMEPPFHLINTAYGPIAHVPLLIHAISDHFIPFVNGLYISKSGVQKSNRTTPIDPQFDYKVQSKSYTHFWAPKNCWCNSQTQAFVIQQKPMLRKELREAKP